MNVKYLDEFKNATGNSMRNNNNKKKLSSFCNSNFGRRQGLNTNQNGWMKSSIKLPKQQILGEKKVLEEV